MIQFPAALKPLFGEARYKVLYGGRGSGKSVGAARALLVQAAERPLRVLCAREFQISTKDSVHKLLSDEIEALGLTHFYEIQDTIIRGRNGSEFIFRGLRHNITSIRSMQGIDRCWVEEAQTVSKASWEALIPTIRAPGSQIWVTFNPELDTDETYTRFVKTKRSDVALMKVNWSENPWFPDVLRTEMEVLKDTDFDAYLTVWEGHCRQVLDGAIYAKEIRAAVAEGRITDVPVQTGIPVETFWDLGWADSTSIWFAQRVGLEYRVVDYEQGSQNPLGHYVEQIKKRGYSYGKHWLPHDAQAKQLGTGRSIEEQMRALGLPVQIVPRLSVADGVNALRTLFPQIVWDQTKCADGLNALRRYRYDKDPDTGQLSRTPKHDDASHGADAARYMAVAVATPVAPVRMRASPISFGR